MAAQAMLELMAAEAALLQVLIMAALVAMDLLLLRSFTDEASIDFNH
jgi:hypothetical protein